MLITTQVWLLIFLFIPVAANYFTEWSGVMDKFKFWLFYRVYNKKTEYNFYRLKPFDCCHCISFWTTVALLTFIGLPVSWPLLIALPFCSAASAFIINKIVNRL